jgi:hypothetical protein
MIYHALFDNLHALFGDFYALFAVKCFNFSKQGLIFSIQDGKIINNNGILDLFSSKTFDIITQ